MTLTTAGLDGMPEARTVFLKSFKEDGFFFFTYYNSEKSQQLKANNKCCLPFYSKEPERQVRLKGTAEKITTQESIRYFDARPEESKIGAWASPQSVVVACKM